MNARDLLTRTPRRVCVMQQMLRVQCALPQMVQLDGLVESLTVPYANRNGTVHASLLYLMQIGMVQ